ncbi:hypothetical protein N1851_009849 [Merluccius polli]|uniref:Uncharacterized protein n=1 Tax=Merluccius polli TaxID=89951 RepID=A0AA47MZ72_MERPO|nr:hypothetical protein N1851_009849 [Merluccius polli]
MNEVADETALVGPVDGTFCYKKRTDGSVNKSMVVCKLCNKEFAYHCSTSSLKYRVAIRLALGRTVRFFNALSGVRRSIKPDAYLSSFLRQPRRS